MKKKILAILFVLAMLLALPLTANAAAGGLSSLTLTYATTLKFDSSGYVCPGGSPRGFTNGPAYGVFSEGNYKDKECTQFFGTGELVLGDVYYNKTKIKLNSSYFNSNPIVSAPSKNGAQCVGGKRLSNTEYEIIYKFTVGNELGSTALALNFADSFDGDEVAIGKRVPVVTNKMPYYFVSAESWEYGYPAKEENRSAAVAGGTYLATYTLKPYSDYKFGSNTKFAMPGGHGKIESQTISADGKSATVKVRLIGKRTWLGEISLSNTAANKLDSTNNPIIGMPFYGFTDGAKYSISEELFAMNSKSSYSNFTPTSTGTITDIVKITLLPQYAFENYYEDDIDVTTPYGTVKSVSRVDDRTLVVNVEVPVSSEYFAFIFDANGGTGAPAAVYGKLGQFVKLPTATPTRSGYDFVTWNMSKEGTSQYSYAPGTGLTYNSAIACTLYAKWTPKQYGITCRDCTVYSDSACTKQITSAAKGTKVYLKADEIAGKDFSFWSVKTGTGASYTVYPSSSDKNGAYFTMGDVMIWATANYKPKTYTITYDANGGSGAPASQTKTHGESIVLSSVKPTTSVPGKYFLCWMNSSITKYYYPGDTYTADANETLYAVWSDKVYHIARFDLMGGSGTFNTIKFEEPKLTVPTAKPTRTGYIFVGWNTKADGSGCYCASGDDVNFFEDVTLYAEWRPIEYHITLKNTDATVFNGASGVDAKYDEWVQLPSITISRDGYAFKGWALTKGATTAKFTATEKVYNLSTTDGDEIILYPVWVPATYTVKYNANGGSGSTGNSSFTYNVEAKLNSNKFTRDGYMFLGWATSATATNPKYTDQQTVKNLTNKDGATVTLYAVWEKRSSYTVKYDANGGTGAPASQIKYEGVALKLTSATPSKSGSVFVGWNTKADGTGTNYASGDTYTANANVTLYAKWNGGAKYDVIFDANGGSNAPAKQVKERNKELTLTTAKPTRNGYTFTGWNTAKDGKGTAYAAGAKYTTNADVTLYAQWKANTYTIKYDANGGTGAPANQTKAHDKALTLSSTKPTRSGYTFKEWNTSKDGKGTKYGPGAKYSANAGMTLYAQWTANTYTVKYDANGGSGAPANQTKTHGQALTLSSTKPTRSGYTFASWNTKQDGTGTKYAAGASYTANANVTLYAQWTKNTTPADPTTYTVKYDANGGSGAPANQSKQKDKTLTLSSTKPTRMGYTFIGWNTAKDGKGTSYGAGASYSANANLTLYAQWKKENTPAPGTPVLKRLAGDGRQQTAALISKEAYSSAQNVFIASGDNYADALAGVPLAYAKNAPILLVRSAAGLDDFTKNEIKRLGAKNVFILGGEGAVSKNVENQIKALGTTITRIAGDDRFATAVKIAEELRKIKGAPKEVFFVYSHNYPDALAASGVAAVKGAPILYVYGDGDLRASDAFVKANKGTLTNAYIIGGYAAIKEAADTNVNKYATVKRVFGDNRYLTCAEINKTFASTLTGKAVCIATGKNFPDALAGGVLAAKTKSPMLLVGDSLLDYQSAYIKAKKPSTVYVFGGTGAVADSIANDALNAAK